MKKTKSYTYYKYPFKYFNPVQTEVLEVLEKANDKNNLVLSANTSAGKTICAEFLIDQELKKGNKVIYLSPLKSLADERFAGWSERFENEEIVIVTSDYVNSDNINQKLNSASIIIMTSEMLDSKSRNYNKEKNSWLNSVGLLIVDESHIISSENRGAAVEVSIIRFTLLNKKSRLMFLSATMSNCIDFQHWLMMLNGKKTDIVESTWRPVELTIHYNTYTASFKESTYNTSLILDYFETEKNKIEKVISIVLEKVHNEKFLVFVHSKAAGRMVVKRLEEENIKSIFHNADLNKGNRKEIEENFKDKDGDLDVLVSTSTLAWGVNLPARNVIIVGTKRGLEDVDSLDIIQMAGRAGRYGIDDAGDVYLILLPGLVSQWKNTFENPRPLYSMLDSPKTLAFHVLAEINNNIIKNEVDLRKWYRKTLRYLQVRRIPLCIDSTLIPSLRRIFMIKDSDPLETTRLGEISSMLYFSPYDVSGWYYNFKSLLNVEKINDYHLSYALFNVPKNETWIPKELNQVLTTFLSQLKNCNVNINSSNGKALLYVFVGYTCLVGDQVEHGLFYSIKREILFDFERIISAIKLIVSTFPESSKKQYLIDTINSTFLRLKYGVPKEAIELVKIKGIGSKRALALIDEGIYTAGHIINPKNKRKLLRIFSGRVYKTVVIRSKEYLKANKR